MNVGVLVSGSGTNLQAIIDRLHGSVVNVVAVVSNRPGIPALMRAERANIPTNVFEQETFSSRQERDAAIADWLRQRDVELVILAGYMQLLAPAFLARFERHVINIHPSLLPAFPGVDAIGQAIEYGVKVIGITVHYVDNGVDTGEIIAQRAVAMPDHPEPDAVRKLLAPIEHDLLCEVIESLTASPADIVH